MHTEKETALASLLDRMGIQIANSKKTNILVNLPGMSSALTDKQVTRILEAGLAKLQNAKIKLQLLDLEPGQSVTFKRRFKYLNPAMRSYVVTYTPPLGYIFTVNIKDKLSSEFGNKKRNLEWGSNAFGKFKPSIRMDSPQPTIIEEYAGKHGEFTAQEIQKYYTAHQEIAKKSQYFSPLLGLDVKNSIDSTEKKMVLRKPWYPQNLRQLMQDPNFSPGARLKCMEQLISAVKVLHADGLEHGNLRAENIFIDAAGNIKIDNFSTLRKFGEKISDNVEKHAFTADWLLLRRHLMQTYGPDFYRKDFAGKINSQLLQKNWQRDIGTLVTRMRENFEHNKTNFSPAQQSLVSKQIQRLTKIRDCNDADRPEYTNMFSEKIHGEQDIYNLGCMLQELSAGSALAIPVFVDQMLTSNLIKTPKIDQVAKDFSKYQKQEQLKLEQLVATGNKTLAEPGTIAELIVLATKTAKEKKVDPALRKIIGDDQAQLVASVFANKSPRLAENYAAINTNILQVNTSSQNKLVKSILLLIMMLHKQQILYDAASKHKSWALFTNLYNAYNMRGIRTSIARIKKELRSMDQDNFSLVYTGKKRPRQST